jgi:hypothetical protein
MNRWSSSLYPTREHEDAAVYVTDFFSKQDCVDAVLLTGSCARGKAVPGSCVDISVLLEPHTDHATRERLARGWSMHSEGSCVLAALAAHGKYAHVDLDMADGDFREGYNGWCSGPDDFELEIGNLLQYSVPLYEKGARLVELREAWLPYYPSELRNRRLSMVGKYCLNNIDHVAPYVERQLYFQAFRRLYNATGEFLQGLFIARRKYPIAYDKWIREQIVEILGLPDLYPRLVDLLSIKDLESTETREKADTLHDMFNEYCAGR